MEYQPNALNHKPFLLWTHLDNEQRADLCQTLQQLHGVHNGNSIDGVGLWKGTDELPQPVVLPVEQAEHHTDQLWVLDKRLLGPVYHSVGYQLL